MGKTCEWAYCYVRLSACKWQNVVLWNIMHHATPSHSPTMHCIPLIFWWPQSTYWKPQVHLSLHCNKEAGLLYTRGTKSCGLLKSVKLGLCSTELNFSLFHDILGEWVNLTITEGFLRNTCWKAKPLHAAVLWKLWSVCFFSSYNEKHSVIKFLW